VSLTGRKSGLRAKRGKRCRSEAFGRKIIFFSCAGRDAAVNEKLEEIRVVVRLRPLSSASLVWSDSSDPKNKV
jgi:hypothetical protein